MTYLISAENVDCGYSVEPTRGGGSNEYPQSTNIFEFVESCELNWFCTGLSNIVSEHVGIWRSLSWGYIKKKKKNDKLVILPLLLKNNICTLLWSKTVCKLQYLGVYNADHLYY